MARQPKKRKARVETAGPETFESPIRGRQYMWVESHRRNGNLVRTHRRELKRSDTRQSNKIDTMFKPVGHSDNDIQRSEQDIVTDIQQSKREMATQATARTRKKFHALLAGSISVTREKKAPVPMVPKPPTGTTVADSTTARATLKAKGTVPAVDEDLVVLESEESFQRAVELRERQSPATPQRANNSHIELARSKHNRFQRASDIGEQS